MTKANKTPIMGGLALIAALVLVGAALAAWKHVDLTSSKQAPFEPPEFVDVVTAGKTTWQPTARLVGTVFAKRSVTLANEIIGVVTRVGFDSGDTVEAGQALVIMDTSTEEAALASAEAAVRLAAAAIDVAAAEVRVAESNLTLARNNHRRFHAAATNNSVSATEMDRIDSDLEKAVADLDRQRSSHARALAELDQAAARAREVRTIIAKKTLVAPFRARAGIRTVHPGQYLGEGTAIVDLTELTDDIYVDFAVPQEHAVRVSPGMVVMARSEVLGGDSTPITVVSIDATADQTTRNVRVRSSVPNPGYTIKPGMFIDVEVPVAPSREDISIPATAVRRAAFGDHVFALTPGDPEKDPPGSMRAAQRMVTLGPDIGGRVIITSGVQEGERIAASGSFKLREGALVFPAPAGGQSRGENAPAQPGAQAH